MRVAADVLTIAVCIVLLALFARAYLPAPPVATPIPTAVHLDGVDFSTAPRTLIMALRSDCPFCQESMPFYRRLLARDREGAQFVVIAPAEDTEIGSYLASGGVEPDSVLFAEPDAMPVPGTPILLLVDSAGLVTEAWIGLLSAERERQVFDALW